MDFSAALDTRTSDVEKPAVLPQGTYIWTVSKVPSISTSNSGEWDIVEFPLKVVSAEEDVDADELEEFGNVAGEMNRVSFMFNKDPAKENDFKRSLYRLKKFCMDTLRVDVEDDASMKEMLDAAVNCQFLASCVWRQVDDETYTDVKNYAPLD